MSDEKNAETMEATSIFNIDNILAVHLSCVGK